MSPRHAASDVLVSSHLNLMRDLRLWVLMEFCASTDEMIGTMMPGRFDEAVIFFIVARVVLQDWIDDEIVNGRGISVPSQISTSIRVSGIANAYGKSPATIARHTRWLIEQGWLTATDTGLAMAIEGDKAVRIVEFYEALHDLFVRAAADTAMAGHADAPGRAPPPPAIASVLVQGMDILMMPLEDDPVMRADFSLASIWGVLFALTLRASQNALANSDVGISVRRVATIISLPYATVWRKFRVLKAIGIAVQNSRGWRVPDDVLDHPTIAPVLRRQMKEIRRRIDLLGWTNASAAEIRAAIIRGPRPYAGEDASSE